MTAIPLKNGNFDVHVGAPNFNRRAVRVHVAIVRDSNDSVSAIALNLPGTGGCGATEEEALNSLREAIVEVIASYADDNEEAPWIDCVEHEDIPEAAKLKWILVNV